jgi:hypothetical protein
MMGEVTPRMAEAILSAPGCKLLLPLKMPELVIVGAPKEPLPHLIDQMIKQVREMIVS